MNTQRIELFSDAVLAIIMTLMVLDLGFPDVETGTSLHDYLVLFTPVLPKLFSFILSFAMIAIYWVNHHHFFRFIERSTIGLTWLNLMLLLWLSLLPFPTSLLGEHPTDQFPIILYSVNLFLCAISFYCLRLYAQKNHLLTANCNERRMLSPRNSLPGMLIACAAIALSFVHTSLSLLCFLLFPILYFLPGTIKLGDSEENADFIA